MDFSAMLPMLLGMMGKNGGESGNNNMDMAGIMSMLGNMNGGGGGTPDMGMLMNMMNNFQNKKPRSEAEPQRVREREDDYGENEPRQTDRPPSYIPDEPPEKKTRTMVNQFFESNGIRKFDPLYFDENKKQFRAPPHGNGSRPIKRIAGEDLSRKIDGYFSGD